MRLFRYLRRKSDLREELESHLKMAIADRVGRGQSPAEARASAMRELGNVPLIADVTRDQWGWLRLEEWMRDTRYALRQLRKSPGFTLTVVITLALGIGANTAIFTLVQGILLRSLPVASPSSLYRIGDKNLCCYYSGFQKDNGEFNLFSYDLYLHLKEQSAAEFEQLSAVEAGGDSFTVRAGSGLAKRMHSEYVSGNYFATLGVGAYAGRPLQESDDTFSAAPAAVISYRTWQTDFAANPGIVGSTIYVQTHPFTVIGIAPPGFFGDRIVPNLPDFWMPLASEAMIEGANSSLKQNDEEWLYPIGRVRPGTNIKALQEKLSVTLRQWLFKQPSFTDHGGAALIPRQHVIVASAAGGVQRLQQQQTGTGLRLLMILSTVVLLIACANVANLMLARYTARLANVAVRMALGAARSRVIRQVLTESVLVSLIGGGAGLAVAYAMSHAMLVLAFPHAMNMPVEASPSLAVLGFAFLVSLLTGVVFGMAPAWLSSHAQPADALRGVNRTNAPAGDRTSLPQRVLVVMQVALSVVLLAGTFLLSRSLRNLEHQNFGIATANRFVLEFDPRGVGYTVDRLPALYRQIEERFSSFPAMAHVSLARYTPLGGNNWGTPVIPQGHGAPGPNDKPYATWDRASTHFLASLGVPIVRGRDFSEQDTATSPPVAIVNQAFQKHFFPNEDPIGRHFGMESPQYSAAFEIVGVFADFKMTDPREEIQPLFFRPLTQQFHGFKEPDLDAGEKSSMFVNFIILDMTQAPADVEGIARKTLAAIDPNLTVISFRTYQSEVDDNFSQDRLIARLTSLFGVLALTLASVGLYGVMSYFVVRRSAEIGIRMALGAARSGVVAMVMRGALWPILMGIVIGVPAALFCTRFMSSLLYEVRGDDPSSFFGAILLLAICAAVAGFIPALRAASIEPIRALRID